MLPHPLNPEGAGSRNKFEMSDRFAGQTAHWLSELPCHGGSELGKEQQLYAGGTMPANKGKTVK